jgi:hypothetical protein
LRRLEAKHFLESPFTGLSSFSFAFSNKLKCNYLREMPAGRAAFYAVTSTSAVIACRRPREDMPGEEDVPQL